MEYNNNNYKEILKALDLPVYWEKRLKKKTQQESELSLRMLDELGEIVPSTVISHKLYSENKSVRKHAKSIFMGLASHDSFKFLDNDFDRDFNALDEVRIHKALVSKSKEGALPILMRWINVATEEKYIAFLVGEIAYFNQVESAQQLIDYYSKTNSVLVKNSIVEAIGKLSYNKAIAVFITDFDYADNSTQRLIIDALGKLGGTESLDFLAVLYTKTTNKERLVQLLENIYKIDGNGSTYFRIKASLQTPFEKTAIAYVELSKQ